MPLSRPAVTQARNCSSPPAASASHSCQIAGPKTARLKSAKTTALIAAARSARHWRAAISAIGTSSANCGLALSRPSSAPPTIGARPISMNPPTRIAPVKNAFCPVMMLNGTAGHSMSDKSTSRRGSPGPA